MTSKTLSSAGLIAGLIAGAFAWSANAQGKDDNLFVSPCGEPFYGPGSQPVAKWFDRVDANHDGKVDKAEFTADAEAFFKRLDGNSDGVLTSDEIYVYEHQIVPEILSRSASLKSGIIRVNMQISPDQVTNNPDAEVNYDHEGSRTEDAANAAAQDKAKALAAFNQGAAFYGFFGDPEPVTAADRNFDFKITHKEFMDQSDRHFARLDAKGRGYFVLLDLPRTPAEVLLNVKRVASR